MESRVLKTLEYDKVIEQVATFCATTIGREAIQSLRPSTELTVSVF